MKSVKERERERKNTQGQTKQKVINYIVLKIE
jgi:hypothetical protein